MQRKNTVRLTVTALMIALNVILSTTFRIEGLAPASSVLNILAAIIMGPFYTTLMAVITALLRMTLFGIPPLAFTGAVPGALLAALAYRFWPTIYSPMVGEFIGTGIIGSILSYPVMIWYTGTTANLALFIYTPRFIGACIIGAIIAGLLLIPLRRTKQFTRVQDAFGVEPL